MDSTTQAFVRLPDNILFNMLPNPVPRLATSVILGTSLLVAQLPGVGAEASGGPAPTIDRSTFFGSSASDAINDLEADAGGNIVLVGRTHMFNPTDFPLWSAYQMADDHKLAPGMHAFVAKFSPTGELVFSTYLGGERNDQAHAVAVDGSGHSYVTGYTQSHIDFGGFALAEFNGFPTSPGAYITNGAVRFDQCVFLTRFDPSGGVVYSTLVTRNGGTGSVGQSVAVDAAGNAYVAGTLESAPMALEGGTVLYSGAFLMKFNPQGTGTLYTNLVPGGVGWDVAVEPDGTAHFVGRFSGSNLDTTPDAYDVPTGTGGGFYQKISPSGAVLYSTAFAPRNGLIRSVALDPERRAVVAGSVAPVVGPLFPGHFRPVNPIQGTYGGGNRDGFLARLDTRLSGTNVVDFATWIGGEAFDELIDVSIDPSGRIYAAGNTESTNLTLAAQSDSRLAGSRDAFVVQINPAATGIEFASHLGGTGWETAGGVTPLGNPRGFAIAGDTVSKDFPTTNAFQKQFRGSDTEGFLTKFGIAIPTPTLVVNSANDLDDGICDSAHCSLREAILAANAKPGAQTISFNITPPAPGTDAGPVIRPTSPLPTLSDPVTIDGGSQPGGGWVALDGANAGPATHGLSLVNTTNCVIRGLAIHSFRGDGIHVFEGGRHTLSHLHVGTDIVGTNRLGNHGAGIHIIASSHNSVIGEPEQFRDTLISGNIGEGIRIEDGYSVSNRIADVRVGINAELKPLGNGVAGIHLINAHRTEITHCTVTGNPDFGIRLSGLDGARIAGCTIGFWRSGHFEFDPPVNGQIGLSIFDCTGVVVEGALSLTADDIALRIERGSSNHVEGSLIGSGIARNVPGRPNIGVLIVDSVRNVIGGAALSPGASPGNTLVGNVTAVEIRGAAAEGNIVRGNRFGGSGNSSNDTGIRSTAPETVVGGDSAEDGNLFMGNDFAAVLLRGPDARGSSVTGNQIESDPAQPGRVVLGFALEDTADIRIGGAASQPGRPPGNVVRGCSTGIWLANTTASLIQGNLVGRLPDEAAGRANHDGVILTGSNANRVGGDERGTENAIVGNAGRGIAISGVSGDAVGEASEANRVTGNFIGVAPDGITAAPNKSHGIHLELGAKRNLIGISPNPSRGGRANVIAHNGGDGVFVDRNDVNSPPQEHRNLIGQNRIFANGGLGIRSTVKDQFPKGQLKVVEVSSGLSSGQLRTTALIRLQGLRSGRAYRIEVYENDACDNSGSGEGQRFLGSHDFAAVAEEQLVAVPLNMDRPPGRYISALLFDDRDNTSEFSSCFEVVQVVDSDGDSVPDTVEDAAQPDANGDGIPDKQQANIARTQSPGGTGTVRLTGPLGGAFSDLQSPSTLPEPRQLPSGVRLPDGYHEFRFTVPVPPQSPGTPSPGPAGAVIELLLPSGSNPDAWFTFGPTPDDSASRWREFRFDGTTGAEISGSIVRLHFIDGQRGDNDLEVNGAIHTIGAAVVLGEGEVRIRRILPAGGDLLWISGTAGAGDIISLESAGELIQWRAESEVTAPFGAFQFMVDQSAASRFFRALKR